MLETNPRKTKMQNPLTQIQLFHTPQNPDELADILNGIGSPEEVALAWQVAAMSMNLAWHMVQAELDAQHA
jgi:hypothetical protein